MLVKAVSTLLDELLYSVTDWERPVTLGSLLLRIVGFDDGDDDGNDDGCDDGCDDGDDDGCDDGCDDGNDDGCDDGCDDGNRIKLLNERTTVPLHAS